MITKVERGKKEKKKTDSERFLFFIFKKKIHFDYRVLFVDFVIGSFVC